MEELARIASPLDTLRADHRNVEKLLRVFEAELARFHDAETVDYETLHDVMHYVTNYPDLTHHPLEEQVAVRLLRSDSSAGPLAQALHREHEMLTAAGTALLHVLDDIAGDVPMPRAAVESQARTYVERLRRHMADEEAGLFLLAAQRLSVQDWADIAAATQRPADPLFGSAAASQAYRAIRERLTATEAARS